MSGRHTVGAGVGVCDRLTELGLLLVAMTVATVAAAFAACDAEASSMESASPLPRADSYESINGKRWIHGAERCSQYRGPKIDVMSFGHSAVMRQSKCDHFEAPFVYLLIGREKALLLDTGATTDSDAFPLYETVLGLVDEYRKAHALPPIEILVAHSHGHSDHTAGDVQFEDKPNVTIVEPRRKAIIAFFGLTDWPNNSQRLELGDRELEIIPVPGHHPQSIAIYDEKTGWMLTGDSLYPGRLHVGDWREFTASIRRLADFARTREVTAILGGHVEMSDSPGVDYPAGSRYQPTEAGLALPVSQLYKLHEVLIETGGKPQECITAKFIVLPQSRLQKALGAIVSWFRD